MYRRYLEQVQMQEKRSVARRRANAVTFCLLAIMLGNLFTRLLVTLIFSLMQPPGTEMMDWALRTLVVDGPQPGILAVITGGIIAGNVLTGVILLFGGLVQPKWPLVLSCVFFTSLYTLPYLYLFAGQIRHPVYPLLIFFILAVSLALTLLIGNRKFREASGKG